MPVSSTDRERLLEALELARLAIGLSDPNPRVGCIIAAADGHLLGRGHTQAAGSAHAEVMALLEARTSGHDTRGATAWVTLEPCSHQGRTAPCCDALIAAGLARVVVALQDPNPLVAGAGIGRLRAAGVLVDLAEPDIATRARELNIGFFSRMERQRPWVRMKIAASLDGRTALENGRSQWITGPLARADGHAWRRRAGAVLTGIGTVLDDDPRLDVRLVPTALQPLRVVVDSRLRTPPGARILQPPGQRLVYAARPQADRSAALTALGVEVELQPHASEQVDLAAVLDDLGRRGINELHVEAGNRLNGNLLRAGLVDELLVYVAPLLLGNGCDMAALGPLQDLADGTRLDFVAVDRIGDDLRLLARPRRST